METFTHSIKHIVKVYGLPDWFVRKCINKLKDNVLKGMFEYRNKNTIFFDNSGMIIFDRIKQYREQGLTFPQIEKRLKKETAQAEKEEAQTEQKLSTNSTQAQLQSSVSPDIFQKFLEIQKELGEERERRIKELEKKNEVILELKNVNHTLGEQLKLLPEGKSPVEIRRTWEIEKEKKIEEEKTKLRAEQVKQNRAREIKSTIEKLKRTSGLRIFKKADLYKKIEELSKLNFGGY
jgi:hypothetical protein